MSTEIDLTIDGKTLYIQELNCVACKYEISEDLPAAIDDVCTRLHEYLEGIG